MKQKLRSLLRLLAKRKRAEPLLSRVTGNTESLLML